MSDRVNSSPDGSFQTAVLISLGVVVVIGVIGATARPANATSVIGFCTMVSVSLVSLLQQKKTVEKVEQLDNTQRVSNMKTDERLIKIDDTLQVVHTLTNSTLTASTQNERDSTFRELVSLKMIIVLQEKLGEKPSDEARTAIATTEQRLTELDLALADRKIQLALVEKQQAAQAAQAAH